jgi:hypothetical protein
LFNQLADFVQYASFFKYYQGDVEEGEETFQQWADTRIKNDNKKYRSVLPAVYLTDMKGSAPSEPLPAIPMPNKPAVAAGGISGDDNYKSLSTAVVNSDAVAAQVLEWAKALDSDIASTSEKAKVIEVLKQAQSVATSKTTKSQLKAQVAAWFTT